MRLGFAVKVLGAGGLPSHDQRRWQSEPSLAVSLDHLEATLHYCDAHDIRMYRMPTGLAPYASHPDLPQFRDAAFAYADRLAEVGALAGELGIRISSHPGQYTVLNSEDECVRELAAVELEVQAELMDGMGLGPESVVVLHVAGGAGGARAALDRFCAGFELLSDAARGRLVIENDDRTFGLRDVLALGERVGRPVSGTSCTTTATTPTASRTARPWSSRSAHGPRACCRRSTTQRPRPRWRRSRRRSAAASSAASSSPSCAPTPT
ncbi:MAG: damage endonuclease [Actinomycetota bacterium]